jgi:hypothetical protein
MIKLPDGYEIKKKKNLSENIRSPLKHVLFLYARAKMYFHNILKIKGFKYPQQTI